MSKQLEFSINAPGRGFHLITDEVLQIFAENNFELPQCGILNLFCKHTSCGLALCENYDPDVRHDLGEIFDHLVPENQPFYYHTLEGSDDMPSHAKSIIVGPSLTIPVTDGRLNLGTWQGIYLCEFRNHASARKIVATAV